MNYADQLKSQMWQKKRLKILNRDEFTCCNCGSSETQLHVHHKIYFAKRNLWEYEDDELMTLCSECHQEITVAKKSIKNNIDLCFQYTEHLTELDSLISILAELNPYQLNETKEYLLNRYIK